MYTHMLHFLSISTVAMVITSLIRGKQEPVIDLSSTERYLLSLQRIKASLSPAQSVQLDTAINAITQHEILAAFTTAQPHQHAKDMINKRLYRVLHGRSAADILHPQHQYLLRHLHA